jgi:O-antigen ligase/polysaccharide polymerase Wzy-like membrane protein
MEDTRSSGSTRSAHQNGVRLAIGLFIALGLCAAMVITLSRDTTTAIAGVFVLGAGFAIVTRYLDSRSMGTLVPSLVGMLLLAWFASTPLVSFWFRIPVERSIITYDRAVFALAVMILLLRRTRIDSADRRFNVTRFEIVWALLAIAALLSVASKSTNIGYATKIAVDSLVLPLVAFHLARNHFDTNRYAKPLVWALISVVLFLFVTGAYEYTSGVNLFQYKGSELIREGEYRVNGPFASDSSYAIISLLLALFLRAAPKLLNIRLDNSARFLQNCAFAAGLAASLLPLFRIVAAALVVSWIVLEAGTTRFRARLPSGGGSRREGEISPAIQRGSRAGRRLWLIATRVIVAATLIIFVLVKWDAMSGAASAEQRLISPNSMYGRLATWEAAITIASNHPLFGVGLCNYPDFFSVEYSEKAQSLELDSGLVVADSPHSNALWITAELGFFVLAIYIVANLYLLVMGFRALTRSADSKARAAAVCFVALVLAYSIPGLALASGAYSDLNLYFFFVLGMLSRRMNVQLTSGMPRF